MSLSIQSQTPQVSVRFGHAAMAATASEGAFSKILGIVDFNHGIGQSTLPHCQVIYAACIASRFVGALQRRSWNEFRETLFRDPAGWTLWFYATPMIHRGFVRWLAPKELQPALLGRKEYTPGKGIWKPLKWLNAKLNPLAWWELPSAKQIAERLEQSLHALAEQCGGKETELFRKGEKALQSYFGKVKLYRNLASFFGLILSVLSLGVGINLINMALTRRNVQAKKAGLNQVG
jgi:hypothetical protein